MLKSKKFLSLVVCAAFLSPTISSAANFNQKVSGKGSAVIEGDVETTQTTAMNNAKKNLILSAMNRLLGTQISETDEMFSAQIPAIIEQFDNFAEITAKTPTREGAQLTISLSANLDEVEFRALLKDLGVGLNQKVREMGSIAVFFDETEKPYDQPKDMFNEYFEYNRDNSDIYKERHATKSSSASASAVSDKSAGSYSNKTALSANSTRAAGYSDKYAGSASNSQSGSSGYSDGYGGGAYSSGAGHSSASVASSSQGYAKSSDSVKAASSTQSAYKNDYQKSASNSKSASSSSSVDDIHMDKEQVIYKKEYKEIKEAPVNSSYVKSQLQKIFKQYGLEFIDASGKLAEYNKNAKTKYASYSALMDSADASKFKDFVKKTTNADYMGIAFSQINYALKQDETTGKYGCTTTQSNVNIFSLKDGKTLDSGALEAVKQSATSIEECKSNARFDMATSLGQTVGLGIQKTIRDATRSFASGPVVYKLTIKGNLNRPSRRGFESIMENKKDLFKNFKMINQDAQSIQYEVTYSGTKSIGDVLLDAATSSEYASINETFNNYDLKLDGSNSVILYPTR